MKSKKIIYLSVLIPLLALFLIPGAAAVTDPAGDEHEGLKVYIVPVIGEIERGLSYFVRRAVREAKSDNADALVILMDTPGGEFAATESIMRTLLNSPVDTYTYVQGYAFSAGAFIAVSTKHIYMAPATVIGAATPIAAGPGGPAEMGEAVEQKVTSGIRAIMRAAAEVNGHPLGIVEAMVDRDVEVEGVIEKGKLLTLTNRQAEEEGIGLSSGTFDNLDEFINGVFGENADVVRTEISWAEKLARFLTSAGVRSLLLMVGLLGIYMEIRTPGIGLAGAAAGISLVLFFFGHYAAGLAGWEELSIFLLGVILLGVELFVIPGFGVTGIIGLILVLISMVMSMTGPAGVPGVPWWTQAQFEQAMQTLGIALAGSILLAVLIFRFILPRTPLWNIISLGAAETRSRGFAVTSRMELLGRTGAAKTMLRPVGKAEIEGEVLNVVSDGGLIQKGEKIRVVSVDGNRVEVVREEDN